MAISRSHDTKSPTQNPADFFQTKQHGGQYGKPSSVGQKLSGGPMREQVMGRASLAGKQTGK